MKHKELVSQLHKENSYFLSDRVAESWASLANTVSTDIYTESERFIFELIQNADDAAKGTENEVHFHFLESHLIVSHNGIPFEEKDVIALASAGASTKKADPNKTGYKGIGFKSVFGKSDNVAVFSGGYQFRFDLSFHKKIVPWQMIPIWTEENELPPEVQSHLKNHKFNVSTIIKIKETNRLHLDLNNVLLRGQLLLFLRNVNRITVSKNSSKVLSVSKQMIGAEKNYNKIALLKDDVVTSSWIVKTFEKIPIPEKTKTDLKKDSKAPDKLKDAVITEVAFAAKVKDGKLIPLVGEESLIFTYLPTKVHEFALPFLVNGSFVTNAARETLNQDSCWNQWLFELIAEKSLDWIEQLHDSSYKYQVLRLFTGTYKSQSNLLKISFDDSLTKNIPLKSFVCTANETLKKTSEVIFDKTGLSNESFIAKESIVDFLNEDMGSKFNIDCFVSPKLEDSDKLKSVGVKTFELDNFELFFKSLHFISKHQIEDNFKLISFCKRKSDEDAKGIWFQRLMGLPFIFDDVGVLANPETGICFPIGIKKTELGNIPLINDKVFAEIQKNPEIHEWLKKLGVKEPSQEAYVTNVIIPGLKNTNYITSANYLPITRYLFRLNKEQKLSHEMLEGLRELPIKVKGSSNEFKQAQFCFLANKYRPSLEIEGIIPEVSIVSEDYIDITDKEVEWNLFFRAIKVKERVELEVIDANNSLPALRIATSPEWVDVSLQSAKQIPNAFGFEDSNIIKKVQLPTFLNFTSKNYKYSQLFWTNIIGQGISLEKLTEVANYRYGVGYGRHKFGLSVENYFPWFLKTQACIPTTTDNLMKAEEVFINDSDIKAIAGKYLPVFALDQALSPEWKQFFKFKSYLGLEDYLKILANITAGAEDEERTKKPGLKRIGNIYNKIASFLPELTGEQKNVIVEWAKTHKLLSTEHKFEPTDQLKWITIKGFNNKSDKLKTIELPEVCKTETAEFKELMSLFQIHVIDAFVPIITDSRQDISLKDRLEKILPYLATVVAKRKMEEEGKEFERLYLIIDPLEFYTASEINLSFDYGGELIEGPSEIVFEQGNRINFKGKWKSEKTLFFLLKKLAGILGITPYSEELRLLLLEQDEMEIREWIQEMNIDLKSIPAVKSFTPKQLEIGNVGGTTSTGTHGKTNEVSSTPKNDAQNSGNSSTVSSVDEDVVKPIETFIPTINAKDVDASGILPTRRKAAVFTGVEEQPVYTEIESDKAKSDIGLWSEEFVNKNLSNWGNYSRITWVNESGESGKPYDFIVIENGVEKFVEVKGTPSADKAFFYLSAKEFQIMFDKGENYFIIRVYRAGEKKPDVVFIENPANEIKNGSIQVALKI